MATPETARQKPQASAMTLRGSLISLRMTRLLSEISPVKSPMISFSPVLELPTETPMTRSVIASAMSPSWRSLAFGLFESS